MQKNIFSLLSLTLLFVLFPMWEVQASLHEAFMVASGDGNSSPKQFYRIPAVATMPDGTVVALYDDRGTSIQDMPGALGDQILGKNNNDKITVVASVSHDQGHSWSAPVPVGGTLKAPYGDASICYDISRQRLVAILNAEKSFGASDGSKVYFTTSTNGTYWETPVEITSQFSNAIDNYKIGFVTSGNILCADDGSLYCAFVTKTKKNIFSSVEYLYIFRSEDGGANWTRTNTADLLKGSANESHLAQLPDGRLLLSVRSAGYRRFMYSSDNGVTWSEPSTHNDSMTDCNVNSDIIAFNDNGTDYLLQVIATEDNPRRNLFAYWSMDNGLSWNSRRLYHGLAGYTSLTRLDDGTFGCLTEVGGMSDASNGGGMSMAFFRFDLNWLLNGHEDSFDGTLATRSTSYMRIEKSDDFSIPANGAMTVSARIWFPVWGQPSGIISNRRVSGSYDDYAGFALIAGWESSRCFSANVTVDGSHQSTTAGVLDHSFANTAGCMGPGEWHHVAWSFDSAKGESVLYVDGVAVERVSDKKYGKDPKGQPISCKHNIFVGARLQDEETPMDVWSGAIDDVRFYNRILTDEEMARDAVEGFPVLDKDNGLIAAYDFEDIVGDQVTDISGNGHTGTLRGDWAEASKNYVTRVLPCEYGTLTVDYFEDGMPVTMREGESITRSVNADYRVHFEPLPDLDTDGFEFIGIFADSRHIDNGGFFKTYGDGEVYVLYAEQPLEFELVNENPFTTQRSVFTYEGDGRYTLEWPYDNHQFYGTYHVEETAGSLRARNRQAGATERQPLTLFSEQRDDFSLDAPHFHAVKDVGHPIVNQKNTSEQTEFLAPTNNSVLTGTGFTLHYTASKRTLAIHYTGENILTGIEDVNATGKEGECRWFNLDGIEVSADALPPGFYIRIQGGRSEKVIIQ